MGSNSRRRHHSQSGARRLSADREFADFGTPTPRSLEVLKDIEGRGAIETAKRVRQRISSVFVHAIAKGIAEKDPAEKLGAVARSHCARDDNPRSPINRLRQMIDDAEQDYARPITRLALRLLALTRCDRASCVAPDGWNSKISSDSEPLWRIPSTQE
jgi:integrase